MFEVVSKVFSPYLAFDKSAVLDIRVSMAGVELYVGSAKSKASTNLCDEDLLENELCGWLLKSSSSDHGCSQSSQRGPLDTESDIILCLMLQGHGHSSLPPI